MQACYAGGLAGSFSSHAGPDYSTVRRCYAIPYSVKAYGTNYAGTINGSMNYLCVIDGIGYQNITDPSLPALSYIPVSYTHLDVYKRPVSSMDLSNRLVLSFQNNHLKTHSNCSLLPNKILKLIQDGLLYYIQTSNCLAFFQNNNFYYEMWYYIGERKNDLVEIVSNKPVQISVIYQIGSNRIEYERNFWFNNGFYKNTIARRMVRCV